MHLLSSKKYLIFNGDMSQVFGTLLYWQTFFGATCISCFRQYQWAVIPGYEVFTHPSWVLKHFFLECFKDFYAVLMKGKSSHKKNWSKKLIKILWWISFMVELCVNVWNRKVVIHNSLALSYAWCRKCTPLPSYRY